MVTEWCFETKILGEGEFVGAATLLEENLFDKLKAFEIGFGKGIERGGGGVSFLEIAFLKLTWSFHVELLICF